MPGPVQRQGTGMPGPGRLTTGLPMGGAVKSGLGKIIGIVTDSDSCPTLRCLVLTGSSRTEKEMAMDTVVSKFLQRWTIFAATKHLLSPPPPPFRFSVLGEGGHNNTKHLSRQYQCTDARMVPGTNQVSSSRHVH